MRTHQTHQQKHQRKLEEMNSSARSNQPLTTHLPENEQLIRNEFERCSDIVFHTVPLSFGDLLLVYVDGLVDTKHLDTVLLQPLLYEGLPQGAGSVDDLGQLLQRQAIPAGQTKKVTLVTDVVREVLRGQLAILAQGLEECLTVSMSGAEKRTISEPVSESVIRGPREGFTESVRTNTSLVRKKIKSTHLKMETIVLGKYSQTDIVIAYMEGICTQELVAEVQARISRIEIGEVLESGYIEEMIEDVPWSPFPQVHYTERPDVVVGNLMEGRVAILVDGTPVALIVPFTIWGALQANEDYYERYMLVSLMRWIRILFAIIALTLPSVYVAITTFHQEMLPTNLLLSIAGAREDSPFPALIEALIMEVTFEALREAGVRLPKPVGQAVSIVGALVIGQAAVEADIVSAPLVIVVAITGIASFIIPRYNLAIGIRLARFPMILLAGTLGLFGIAIGCICLLIHLTSLRSFGVPYLNPVAPLTLENLKDVFLRVPWWSRHKRPRLTGALNPVRIPSGQKPGPPEE